MKEKPKKEEEKQKKLASKKKRRKKQNKTGLVVSDETRVVNTISTEKQRSRKGCIVIKGLSLSHSFFFLSLSLSLAFKKRDRETKQVKGWTTDTIR